MYRIGEFSKMTKTTIKTLRYYDEVGLLQPAFVDQQSGYRYYTSSQMLPLHRIVNLRQVGLSIEDILEVMSGRDPKDILLNHQQELVGQMATLQRQFANLTSILQHDKEGYQMPYQAVLKDLPAYTVYYKEGVVKSFADYPEFILGSAEECRQANPGITCLEPDYCYISYLDPEYREEDIRIQYAQAVTAPGKETASIKFKTLQPTKVISVLHQGPYDTLPQAYAFAFNWLEENGYTQTESVREHYIDGMWNKQDPADWLTEIQIPVA